VPICTGRILLHATLVFKVVAFCVFSRGFAAALFCLLRVGCEIESSNSEVVEEGRKEDDQGQEAAFCNNKSVSLSGSSSPTQSWLKNRTQRITDRKWIQLHHQGPIDVTL